MNYCLLCKIPFSDGEEKYEIEKTYTACTEILLRVFIENLTSNSLCLTEKNDCSTCFSCFSLINDLDFAQEKCEVIRNRLLSLYNTNFSNCVSLLL